MISLIAMNKVGNFVGKHFILLALFSMKSWNLPVVCLTVRIITQTYFFHCRRCISNCYHIQIRRKFHFVPIQIPKNGVLFVVMVCATFWRDVMAGNIIKTKKKCLKFQWRWKKIVFETSRYKQNYHQHKERIFSIEKQVILRISELFQQSKLITTVPGDIFRGLIMLR